MYRVVNGAIIRDSFETAAGAMARVADIMDRHDQREAQYAVGMATEFVRNGWEGFDTVGSDGKPVRTRGIRELGWSELERDETSVSEKTRELLKSVREQDFYRNMSGGQRKLFERSWAFKESELNRAASVRTGELVRQRAVDHDKELLALHTKQVADRNGKADGSYEKTRDWATMQNFGIMMGTGLRHREILDDPNATFDDVAKAEGWDDETKELTRMKFDKLRATFDVGRVQALVEAGASNRSLGDVSAEETLVLAKRVAHSLNGRDYDGKAVDGAHKYVDDAQYNDMLSAIGKADKLRVQKAEAIAGTLDKKANEEDLEEYNKTAVACLDPDFVPKLSKDQKLDAIMRDPRLSPASRSSLMAKWSKWYDSREADAAERRANDGYEMQLADGKSVWISATRWGKTQADVYDWFTSESIARDPVKAIARAEALKATGSISKEDYTHAIATATSLQNKNVVEAANKALGGNFFKIVDTTNPGKGSKEGPDFGDDLAYKYDPNAKTGFTGSFQTRGFFGSVRNSSMTDDMRQLDKTGEKLFTPEEKTSIFSEIGWMASRGYTQEQIDECVKQIVAPKIQLYYNMTMQERLANPAFMRQIRESVTSFDDTVSAIVSKTTSRPVSKVKNAPEE